MVGGGRLDNIREAYTAGHIVVASASWSIRPHKRSAVSGYGALESLGLVPGTHT